MNRLFKTTLLSAALLFVHMSSTCLAEQISYGIMPITTFPTKSITIQTVIGTQMLISRGSTGVPVRIPAGKLIWNDGMEHQISIQPEVNFIRVTFPQNSNEVLVSMFADRPSPRQIALPMSNPMVYGPVAPVRIGTKRDWTNSFRVTMRTMIGDIELPPGQAREFPVKWGVIQFFDGRLRATEVPMRANWAVAARDYQGNIHWTYFRR